MRNALRIFEAVASEQPVGLKRLTELLDLPPTTVHRMLGTLAAAGWLACAPGPGRRWMSTGRMRRLIETNDLALVKTAAPFLRDLRDRCRESVSLAVPDGQEMVILTHLDGASVLRVVHVEGTRAPIHAAATGKAVLAHLSTQQRRRYLGSFLERYTSTTLADTKSLESDLELIRARGWAVMAGEWIEEVSSVAAAIVDQNGHPIAGIGVSVPAVRLTQATGDQLGRLVRASAEAVSIALQEVSGSGLGEAG